MDTRYGRVKWGINGTRSKTKTWNDPVKWNREAITTGVKKKVFCASLADVFEDFHGSIMAPNSKDVLWRDRHGRYDEAEASGFRPYEIATIDLLREDLFKLIDCCQDLYWLLLTKRPENIKRMWPDAEGRENVWLGTSIANQKNADEYVDRLLESKNKSPVLWLSLEPQISFVDLKPWLHPEPLIHWVIVGGESRQGRNPRPFHVEWAADVVEQCHSANIPCFVKQLGSNVWRHKRKIILSNSHGDVMSEWPEHVRVRECPEMFHATM